MDEYYAQAEQPIPGGAAGAVEIYKGDKQIGAWIGWNGDVALLPQWLREFGFALAGPSQEGSRHRYAYTRYELVKV